LCVSTPITCEDGNKCNGVYVCAESSGQCVIDKPVVDCNDNNACTIDTCVTSTGLCTYATKNCDDSNPCTVNDTCDPSSGCVIQPPLDNCCGNMECEADIFETPETCPRDCSTSITAGINPALSIWGMVVSGMGVCESYAYCFSHVWKQIILSIRFGVTLLHREII
jgi:hypothetical protein